MPRGADIRFRGDTASAWVAVNPVLNSREPGVESDTGRTKIGNGVLAWNDLPYVSAGPDLPSYAPPLQHAYNPETSTLNLTEQTSKRFRVALARTYIGLSSTHWAATGDSSQGGYNGSTYQIALAMPRQAALVVAMAMGVNFYDGVHTANKGSAVGDRWVLSGGANTTTGNNFVTLTGAGYAEYTSPTANTCDLYYSDLSSPFSYQVDGGTVTNITPGGTATWKKVTFIGLSTASHKIRVNWVSGNAYVGGAMGWMFSQVGLYFHDLSLGGGTAATGNAFINWSDTSNPAGVRFSHMSMMAMAGLSISASYTGPDVHTCSIGGNDHAAGTPNSSIMAGLASMKAMWDCDFVNIRAYMAGAGSDATTFADLCRRQMVYADTSAHVLFDWNDLVGGRTGIVALNAMSADGVHALAEVNVWAGRVLGKAMCPSAAPDVASRAYVDATKLDISTSPIVLPGNTSVSGTLATTGSTSVGGTLTGNNIRENAVVRTASFTISGSTQGLNQIDTTAGSVTVTLYNSAALPGQRFTFVKTDAGTNQVLFTVAGGGSVLAGAPTMGGQGDVVVLESTSTAGVWIYAGRARLRDETYRNLSASGGLTVSGGATFGSSSKLGNVAQKNVSYTITSADRTIEATVAGITITLPNVTTFNGYEFVIVNTSTGSITVSGAQTADLIGNSSTAAQLFTLTAGATLHLIAIANKWRIV